jgi:probable rRNA maturation factor
VAAQVLRWEGARTTRVEVALLDAAAMRRLNRRVTGRRGLTDVLAFGLPQPDGRLLGDVYVCPAAAQAYVRERVSGDPEGRGRGAVEEELVRLAVHGTLHVLGYDHPEGVGRTRSAMWRRQERYVRRLAGGGGRGR